MLPPTAEFKTKSAVGWLPRYQDHLRAQRSFIERDYFSIPLSNQRTAFHLCITTQANIHCFLPTTSRHRMEFSTSCMQPCWIALLEIFVISLAQLFKFGHHHHHHLYLYQEKSSLSSVKLVKTATTQWTWGIQTIKFAVVIFSFFFWHKLFTCHILLFITALNDLNFTDTGQRRRLLRYSWESDRSLWLRHRPGRLRQSLQNAAIQ